MPRVVKWLGDAMEGVMGSKMPLMKVLETVYISKSIKKIRFQGDLDGMTFQLGYAVAIRVSDTEFRNYTASFADSAIGIIEIIFHLHGTAPGSTFIDNLQKGDSLRISMPRGQKQYDPFIEQQLVFGDETSLGLAYSFYPFLKKNQHQYQFYFELDETNKQVPQLLGLDHYTIFPKNNSFRNEQWVHDLPVFKTPCWQSANFILAGNAKSVQTFRKVLKNNHTTGKIFSKGYWLEGKAGL